MLKRLKVVIAISGGVDSSAAAFLLQKQGYEVIGMFMRLAPLDSSPCGIEDNIQQDKYLTGLGVDKQQESEDAARRVCQKLGIKFYPINLARQFKKEVIDYFLNSYVRGLTPNPCVKCNQVIKFGYLLEQAKKTGADFLATGHYVQNSKFKILRQLADSKFIYKLFRGKDKDKDQSYFLYNLTQEQLARVLFPLGGYTKIQVKKIANKAEMPYLKKESQDICFLTGDHNDFLKKHLNLKSGKIKILDGKIVGEHQGLPLYTIGQRKGVEIGGIGPFYVAKCDYKANTLYVVKDCDDPVLYSNKLIAENVNWISGKEPKLPLQCEAVIRYHHQPVKCIVVVGTGHCPVQQNNRRKYLIKFKKPQRAVTPGQSVVLYQGDEVLGGGIISNL